MKWQQKSLIMMVGLPASGKSTIVSKLNTTNAVVLSTDAYIERKATEMGTTYSEIFEAYIDEATLYVEQQLQEALRNNVELIIWDQTNLSKKVRRKKLEKIPDDYCKIACVVYPPPVEEWARRLKSRPGKHIPTAMIERMLETFQAPSAFEGFDYIQEFGKANEKV